MRIYERYMIDEIWRVPDSPSSLILVMMSICTTLIGEVGNTMIILILYQWIRQSDAEVSSHLFEILCIVQAGADIACLSLSTFWIISVFGFNFDFQTYFCAFCEGFGGTLLFTYGISTFIITVTSVARYTIVYYPFRYEKMAGKRTGIILVVVILCLSANTLFGFISIRSVQQRIINGTFIQYCGTDPPSIKGAIPYIYFGVVFMLLPWILVVVLVVLGQIQKRRFGNTGVDSNRARVMSALNNNIYASINLLQSIPLIFVFSIITFIDANVQMENTTFHIALEIGLVPKAVNVVILYNTSEQFKRLFRKTFKYRFWKARKTISSSNLSPHHGRTTKTTCISEQLSEMISITVFTLARTCHSLHLFDVFSSHKQSRLSTIKDISLPYADSETDSENSLPKYQETVLEES